MNEAAEIIKAQQLEIIALRKQLEEIKSKEENLKRAKEPKIKKPPPEKKVQHKPGIIQLGILRKLPLPDGESDWRDSPVLHHMQEMDRKRAAQVIKAYEEKLRHQKPPVQTRPHQGPDQVY